MMKAYFKQLTSRVSIRFTLKQKSVECFRDLDLALVKVARCVFLSHFRPLLKRAIFYGKARSLPIICLSLKSNDHGKVKLVQIPDTHGTKLNKPNLHKMKSKDFRLKDSLGCTFASAYLILNKGTFLPFYSKSSLQSQYFQCT